MRSPQRTTKPESRLCSWSRRESQPAARKSFLGKPPAHHHPSFRAQPGKEELGAGPPPSQRLSRSSQGGRPLQPPQDIVGGGRGGRRPSSLPGLTVTPDSEAPAKLHPRSASPEGSCLQWMLPWGDVGTRRWPNTPVMRGDSGLSMGQTWRKYPSIPNSGAEPQVIKCPLLPALVGSLRASQTGPFLSQTGPFALLEIISSNQAVCQLVCMGPEDSSRRRKALTPFPGS